MKISKVNLKGVTEPFKDEASVTMITGYWYHTDLEPLLKINKKSGGVMTYNYYLSRKSIRTYTIRGEIHEVNMKTRVFDSTVSPTATKTGQQMAIDTLQSKWNKKRNKDGWVTDLDAPPEVQEPMLLHRWDKASAAKKKGPWLVGTKLDGLCSIYMPEEHNFYSRKRSVFTVDALANAMTDLGPIGAHGELYKHGHTWEEISGAVSRGKDALLDSEGRKITLQNSELHFHMFDRHDMPREGYLTRLESLLDLNLKSELLHVVPSVYCEHPEEVEEALKGMLKLGFEGAVARKLNGMYSWNSRSWEVLKLKPLFSKEFLLHSITYDNDAKFGRLISYNLCMADGQTFKATPSKGKAERAEDYERLRGRHFPEPMWMTCEYRDVYANGKPKFAVAKGFRSVDDFNMEGN